VVDNYNAQLLDAVVPAQVLLVGGFLFYLRRRLFTQRTATDEDQPPHRASYSSAPREGLRAF
jgi:hypothetical protein